MTKSKKDKPVENITTQTRGRPTDYNLEITHEICEEIASSTKGIKRLCKENPHWPSHNAIYRWLNKYKDFSDLYARAKQQQVEALVDSILEIADDTSNDYIINDEGKLIPNHEHINRCRLRIDSIKWLAGKLAPRIYGDKTIQESKVSVSYEEALKELE